MPHFITHSHSLLRISKEDKRRRGRRKEERDLLFGLWSFALGHFLSPVLEEILYYLVLGWLSILRKFSLLGFLPHEGFPGHIVVVSVIVSLSVILVLIVYHEYCKDILNLSIHT